MGWISEYRPKSAGLPNFHEDIELAHLVGNGKAIGGNEEVIKTDGIESYKDITRTKKHLEIPEIIL